ncbi:MAG: hypothetical protein AAF787_15305 [Chloroflexota bacterium]
MGICIDCIHTEPFTDGSVIQMTFGTHWTLDTYIAVAHDCYYAQLNAMPHRVDIIADMRRSQQSNRYAMSILLTQAAIRLTPNTQRFIVVGASHDEDYLPTIHRRHPRLARRVHLVDTVEAALNYVMADRGLRHTPEL